jgi:hypothetical protein
VAGTPLLESPNIALTSPVLLVFGWLATFHWR